MTKISKDIRKDLSNGLWEDIRKKLFKEEFDLKKKELL